MARLRNRIVKAEYYTDGELMRWHRDKRHTYQGLWALAEDSGCLEDDPFEWKMILWPSPMDTDITTDMLQQWRDELVEAGKLIPYEVDGKRYLFVKNFHDHEKPRNPQQHNLPLPPWVTMKTEEGKAKDGKRWSKVRYEVYGESVQTSSGDENRSPALPCSVPSCPDPSCPVEKNSPAADSLPSTMLVDECQEDSEIPFDRVWALWRRKERKIYARQQFARISDGDRAHVFVVAEELARRVPKGCGNVKKVPSLGPWLRDLRWTEWAHGVPTTWQDPAYPGPVFKGYEPKVPAEPKPIQTPAQPRASENVDATGDDLDALLGPPVHGTGHRASLDQAQVLPPSAKELARRSLEGVTL